MKAAFLLRVLSATSLLVNANADSIDHQQREVTLDDFITAQQDISLYGMLDNIFDGMVVAGRSDPDCTCLEPTIIDRLLTIQTGSRGLEQLR